MNSIKKIDRSMSICMAITFSFFVTLVGTLVMMVRSGRFDPAGFAICFVANVVLGLIIGYAVPIGKMHFWFEKKFGVGDILGRYVESMVTDLIYAPIMSLLIVCLSCFVMNRAQSPPFWETFLPLLGISFVLGFILAFIFIPFYIKLLIKKYGIKENYDG